MYILFLANHYRGPERAGGARTWHQVQRLSSEFQVELIVPRIDPLTQEDLKVVEFSSNLEGRMHFASCLRGSRRTLLGRLIYQLSSALGMLFISLKVRRPDAVVAMGAPPASAAVGLIVARMRRVPLLLDVRDIPLETAEELGVVRATWLLKMAKLIESAVFRHADRLICVSDEMADFVVAKGVPRECVGVNYIGYDNFEAGIPKSSANSCRSALTEGLDKRTEVVVFYAGTLATLVDIPTVMHAAQQLLGYPSIGFVIVGEGEKRKAYMEWAEADKLNITFPGRLPKQKVHEFCTAADICVYPLKGGPATGAMLGNKIFDYLGAGKPVIYTGPEGAVPHLINRLGAGRILGQEDADGLASVLKELVDEPSSFIEMGRIAQKKVLGGLTAAHSADQLAHELVNLMTGKNLPPETE